MLKSGLAKYAKENEAGKLVLPFTITASMKFLVGGISLEDLIDIIQKEVEENPDIAENPNYLFYEISFDLNGNRSKVWSITKKITDRIFGFVEDLIKEFSTIQKGVFETLNFVRYFDVLMEDRAVTVYDDLYNNAIINLNQNFHNFDSIIFIIIGGCITAIEDRYEFTNTLHEISIELNSADFIIICNIEYLINLLDEYGDFYISTKEFFDKCKYNIINDDHYIYEVDILWIYDRRKYIDYICHNNRYNGINFYYNAPLDYSSYTYDEIQNTSAEQWILNIHTLYDWINGVIGPECDTAQDLENCIESIEDNTYVESIYDKIKAEIYDCCYFIDLYKNTVLNCHKYYPLKDNKYLSSICTFDRVAASADSNGSSIVSDHLLIDTVKTMWKNPEEIYESALITLDREYETLVAVHLSIVKKRLKEIKTNE